MMRTLFGLITLAAVFWATPTPAAHGEDGDSKGQQLLVDARGVVTLGESQITKSGSMDALRSAWGKPDRETAKRARAVHIWDLKGVSAGLRRGATFYAQVHVAVATGHEVPGAPKGAFPGRVLVAGTAIGAKSSKASLKAAGFVGGLASLGELAKSIPEEMRKVIEAQMTHTSMVRDLGATRVSASFSKKTKALTSLSIEFPWSADPVRAPLAELVVAGDVAQVRKAIERGGDANAKNAHQRSLLHLASIHGHLAVATLLIERGAEVSARDKFGATPLHGAASRHEWRPPSDWEGMQIFLAAGSGHEAVARLLLENGADPNALDQGQETPLHRAASSGSLGIAKLLLGKKAKVDPRDEYGATPLFEVARGGVISELPSERGRPNRIPGAHLEVVALLLKAGADPNARSEISGTPLSVAAEHGAYDIAHALMEGGAKPGATWPQGTRGPVRSLAFFVAAYRGDVRLMKAMIEKGASVKELRGLGGQTPLHAAARGGHVEAVRFLLEQGADIKATDNAGNTPCHAAAGGAKSAVAVLQALHKQGGDLRAKNHHGQSLVHAAASSCLVGEDVIDFLAKSGLDLNEKDARGRTPRQIAENTDCLLLGSAALRALKKRGAR